MIRICLALFLILELFVIRSNSFDAQTVSHEIIENSHDFSTLRVRFETPQDHDDNGSPILGYKVEIASVPSYEPYVVSVRTRASDFVSGYFSLSYGFKGNYNRPIQSEDEIILFAIQAGSNVARPTITIDLKSIIAPNDSILIHKDIFKVSQVYEDYLVLGKRYELGTGSSPVKLFGMDTVIGLASISTGDDYITIINIQNHDDVHIGDYIAFHDSFGQLSVFQLTFLTESSLQLDRPYLGESTITSIFKRKVVKISTIASANSFKHAVESLPEVGSIVVNREGPTSTFGYLWKVTMASNGQEECPLLCLMAHSDDNLLGLNADVEVETVSNGSLPSFENIIYSKVISERVKEVQSVAIEWNNETFVPEGFFYISFRNQEELTKIDFYESSADFAFKLRLLPTVGSLDVSKSIDITSIKWTVTFLSNIGDLEDLIVHDVKCTDGAQVSVLVTEITKGIDFDRVVETLIPATVDSIYSYVARVTPINSAGYGKSSLSVQKEGKGIFPIFAKSFSEPGFSFLSFEPINDELLDVHCNTCDSDSNYILEWTSLNEFASNVTVLFSIQHTNVSDVWGTFKIQYHYLDWVEISPEISFIHVTAREIGEVLQDMNLFGSLSISSFGRNYSSLWWELTIEQYLGAVGTFDIDISTLKNSHPPSNISKSVIQMNSPKFNDGNYGFDVIYASDCFSLTLGENSQDQILSLAADDNGAQLTSGSYKLMLDREVSECIPFNASASDLKHILSVFKGQENISISAEPSSMTETFPYFYRIRLGSSSYSDIWPELTVDPGNFGSGDCQPFIGGTNHRGISFPVRNRKICVDSSPTTQVILIKSTLSSVIGQFELSYKGRFVTISVTADNEVVNASLHDLFLSYKSLKVRQLSLVDSARSIAWIISYDVDDNNYDELSISRIFCDSSVTIEMYPLLNFTTLSSENNSSGDFRLKFGQEVTQPISVGATNSKILSELHQLRGIHSVELLQSVDRTTQLTESAILDNALGPSLIVPGDLSTSISVGGEIAFDSCVLVLSDVKYERYYDGNDGSLLMNTKYKDSMNTLRAKNQGYTIVTVDIPDGYSVIDFCNSNERDSVLVSFGYMVSTSDGAIERLIAVKSHSTDLSTFEVIPEGNWRGTRSQLFAIQPYQKHGGHLYIQKNQQTYWRSDESPSVKFRLTSLNKHKKISKISNVLTINKPLKPSLPRSPRSISLYQVGSGLQLEFLPARHLTSDQITKNLIECDTEGIFDPYSESYVSSLLAVKEEKQEIILSCSSLCRGTFRLEWGGLTSNPIDLNSPPTFIADEISNLICYGGNCNIAKVTKIANGYGAKWKVTFDAFLGDLGMLNVDYDSIEGDDPHMQVVELQPGSKDIFPGSFTNEVQSISVHIENGYNYSLGGTFQLTFEGEESVPISVTSSSSDVKRFLEKMRFIRKVNVERPVFTDNAVCWLVTFVDLHSENPAGAVDVPLLKVSSTAFLHPMVTAFQVFENVKGTNPLIYFVNKNFFYPEFYCRVSSYNSKGYGKFSKTISFELNLPPKEPNNVTVVSGETSLHITWQNVKQFNPNTGYELEWYSGRVQNEVQQVTTSTSDGIVEIQCIRTSATLNNIRGTFKLFFKGEGTESIHHDAQAEGKNSIASNLRKLTSIGDVEVSRRLSKRRIHNYMFKVEQNRSVIETNSSVGMNSLFMIGEKIYVHNSWFEVKESSSSSILLDRPFDGPSGDAVAIYRWAFGYEWFVTFVNRVGPQPLLVVIHDENWSGTTSSIRASRIVQGCKPFSGHLKLNLNREWTSPIPHNASAMEIKIALENLASISEVEVSKFVNTYGYHYMITFYDLGDIPKLGIDYRNLGGPNSKAKVSTVQEGVYPDNFGQQKITDSTTSSHEIHNLSHGVSYFTRLYAQNDKGRTLSHSTTTDPVMVLGVPGKPVNVSVIALSNILLKVSWEAPSDTGTLSFLSDYLVEWDVLSDFSSESLNKKMIQADDSSNLFCTNIRIDSSYSNRQQYIRVSAYNGKHWSQPSYSRPSSLAPLVQTPGKVTDFYAYATSSIGIMAKWSPPSINTCDFGGDGGLEISHYILEWDQEEDFSFSPESAILAASSTSYLIGGRNAHTGQEESILQPGSSYFIRIIAFNALGAGEVSVLSDPITEQAKRLGPLTDRLPDGPISINGDSFSASSVIINWTIADSDGGATIEKFIVEHDSDFDFSTSKNFEVPVIREVQSITLESNDVKTEIHKIIASVRVANEIQSIRTRVNGADEIQTVTTTADDVLAEVQTITLYANDVDEVQILEPIAEDIDEIQLLRIRGQDIPEIQKVSITVDRNNEVQQLGILISGINTNLDNDSSMSCYNLGVGDPCQDIEDSLVGSFTVSYDFDECGGTDANFCQSALSVFDSELGMITCTPGKVSDPTVGGKNCVSSPVSFSFTSQEGDYGTLQWAINSMVDDDGKLFMTNSKVPGKSTAVSVEKYGRIVSKGTCNIPENETVASCDGKYEVVYRITFDAQHSTGDVPPLKVVFSDVEVNTTSTAYLEKICPMHLFSQGCTGIIGSSSTGAYGSFYKNSLNEYAVEITKGSQPTGMVTLNYECESMTIVLGEGFSMSAYNFSATFDDLYFLSNVKVGHWLRFSVNDGPDQYREIAAILTEASSITLKESIGSELITSFDVEIGTFFSDWKEDFGLSGVSLECLNMRIQSTLPIDISSRIDLISEADWKQKLGALHAIDITGLNVSRNIIRDSGLKVGHEWLITFSKQSGAVNEMTCKPFSGDFNCEITTVQNSSIIQGHFRLGSTWPHEYVSESQTFFQSSLLDWNVRAQVLQKSLTGIRSENDFVFGDLEISRTPYVTPGHLRWSGGYTWTITFLSRGGNIPAMIIDSTHVEGYNAVVEISDEHSGIYDFYNGEENFSFFEDDPFLARDGNQVSGSFALSWLGNDVYESVITTNVFPVCNGGTGSNKFTALSGEKLSDLISEHIFQGSVGRVVVSRSLKASQVMGYAYSIRFVHEEVGGDVPLLNFVEGDTLGGENSRVEIMESQPGAEIRGTFQLRFNGQTTRPINFDASSGEVAEALNELKSVFPSAVIVSRSQKPLKLGPSNGIDGISTQVGGYSWKITFASNKWKDPTLKRNISDIPGNWFGPPTHIDDTWETGFSKAWGKNVGDVPMIQCLSSGLHTTGGEFPENGCYVVETLKGTEPVGGTFRLCLDTATSPNGVTSVLSNECTEEISINAQASSYESAHDGSSVEEKLEALSNVGDVHVTRSDVNTRNGGYTWTITFVNDADGPCQQRDNILGICNSPGNLPKLCLDSTLCETSQLKGSCKKPFNCSKLWILDETDATNKLQPAAGMEIQKLLVKDVMYSGWRNGPYFHREDVISEYKIGFNGFKTACISHDASSDTIQSEIQNILDATLGGMVLVEKSESSKYISDAPNGFIYYLKFYDTGDLPLLITYQLECSHPFAFGQEVVVTGEIDGDLHKNTCENCQNGVVQRGNITRFEVPGDDLEHYLPWNASPELVKNHLNRVSGRYVNVERTILDRFGSCEWRVTFLSNPGYTPPGSGDIGMISFAQEGPFSDVTIEEIRKGSSGLGGSFQIYYGSNETPIVVAFNESASRLEKKLKRKENMGWVYVTKDCFPDCSSGGWGFSNVSSMGEIGGLAWSLHFLRNPGSTNGFTFPSGSGHIQSPTFSHADLKGDASMVQVEVLQHGTPQLEGTFRLKLDSIFTEDIEFDSPASYIEDAILESFGLKTTVRTGQLYSQRIPDITASINRGDRYANMNGGDWRKFFAPGDHLHFVNENEEIISSFSDGSRYFDTVRSSRRSPILVTGERDKLLLVGQKVRLGDLEYKVLHNGKEIQAITMHRGLGSTNQLFYTLHVSVGNYTEATMCIPFDGSSAEVQNVLNNFTLINPGSIVVTSSYPLSSGIPGDPHVLYFFFEGDEFVSDVKELIIDKCSKSPEAQVPYANVRTIRNGGQIEHQRISLAVDSGTNVFKPSLQLTITGYGSQAIVTPCIPWGASSLSLNSILKGAFASVVFQVGYGGVQNLGNGVYRIHSDSFIEGLLLEGDAIQLKNSCSGKIVTDQSINGTTVTIMSREVCVGSSGDDVLFLPDTRILESSTHQQPVIALTEIILTSSEELQQNDAVFRIAIEFMGTTRLTDCLRYGEEASIIQSLIDNLFDYNLDGLIDIHDSGHVRISRYGNGSSTSSYGFTYNIESRGSPVQPGPSGVLGSQAPSINGIHYGFEAGCNDFAESEILEASGIYALHGSRVLENIDVYETGVVAGSRVRIDTSFGENRIYTVANVNFQYKSITLVEPYSGASTFDASIYLVNGPVPHFTIRTIRSGANEYEYDIFFIGSYWHDVPTINVNRYGDENCPLFDSDMIGGMNRNIGVLTVNNGGESSDESKLILDNISHITGEFPLYTLPTLYSVQYGASVTISVIVKDIEPAEIWDNKDSSFKMKKGETSSICIRYDSTETEFEQAMKIFCDYDDCITVVKSLDPTIAPNGFVYDIYMNGGINYWMDMTVDDSDPECVLFSSSGGEFVDLQFHRVKEDGGKQFTSDKLWLADETDPASSARWMHNDMKDLTLYRVSGTFWTVRFDEYLGDVPSLEIGSQNMPSNFVLKIHDNFFLANDPQTAVINNLNTGIPRYARVSAVTNIGRSSFSSIVSAIPSTVPSPIEELTVEASKYINEVQSLSITARRINEIQIVQTNSNLIPEVQEVTIVSDSFGSTSNVHFSLRFPEIQYVRISSESSIIRGSFSLKLSYIDVRASSEAANGQFVRKLMLTPCLPFGSPAVAVQSAMEENALQDGLPLGSVVVARSGDGTDRFNFGYEYVIKFTGRNLRGNIEEIEMVSDTSSHGGSLCDSFESLESSPTVDIGTYNPNKALGTDTPHVTIIINADGDVAFGEFFLAVSYLGHTMNTNCIAWDADESTLQKSLMDLANIDSVFVEKRGDGMLSRKGSSIRDIVHEMYFKIGMEKNELISSSSTTRLTRHFAVNDRVSILDGSAQEQSFFYKVIDVSEYLLILDQDISSNSDSFKLIIHSNYEYTIFFDGLGMHPDVDGVSHFLPSRDVQVVTHGCKPFQLYVHDKLLNYEDSGFDATIFIKSTYDGGNNMAATSHDVDFDISSVLNLSLGKRFTSMSTTQSVISGNGGLTFTIIFDGRDGDIDELVCSGSSDLILSGVLCFVDTVTNGNKLSGHFHIGSSGAIQHDATAFEMKYELEKSLDIGKVEIERFENDKHNGYQWHITFIESIGDIDLMPLTNFLRGANVSLSIAEEIKGNELGGSFVICHGEHMTGAIPANVSTLALKDAIQTLGSIGEVALEQLTPLTTEKGKTFLITFLDLNFGDVDLLEVDGEELTGIGAAVTVREEIKGSVPSDNSLHASFNHISGCSRSEVTQGRCGSPIKEVSIELSSTALFHDSVNYSLVPDLQVQVIKVGFQNPLDFGDFELRPISGTFRMAYGDYVSRDISVSASAASMRIALESLPSIVTITVSKEMGSIPFYEACIDLEFGKSLVKCSVSCECKFGSRGLRGNTIIKISNSWFRVASTYQGDEEQFELGSFSNSLNKILYKGSYSLIGEDLRVWSGSHEWKITFHAVSGQLRPLTSPSHNLYPPEAYLTVDYLGCFKCIKFDNLAAWDTYFVRSRAMNEKGWGEYSTTRIAETKNIPPSPTELNIRILSGTCVRVDYSATLDLHSNIKLTGLIIQWSKHRNFSEPHIEIEPSCDTHEYGWCRLDKFHAEFYHDVCNLIPSEKYFFRLAFSNDVEFQTIISPVGPMKYINWSSIYTIIPEDQLPDAPIIKSLFPLSLMGFQITFDPPLLDGGKEIKYYVIHITHEYSQNEPSRVVVNVDDIMTLGESRTFVYSISDDKIAFRPWVLYRFSIQAATSVGVGEISSHKEAKLTTPPQSPRNLLVKTPIQSPSPITEAHVSWSRPSNMASSQHLIEGYSIEWWSDSKCSEIQQVRLLFNSTPSIATFTLAFSPNPSIRKVTSLIPWDASSSLVRRELMSLGWDVDDDRLLIDNILVHRENLSNGILWTITFGLDSLSVNVGDIPSLSGSLASKDEGVSIQLTVTTIANGSRVQGSREIQVIQIFGSGILTGFYRLSMGDGLFSPYISANATSNEIELAIKQLPTSRDISVSQVIDDLGTTGKFIRQYEVTFLSNVGNIEAMVIDDSGIMTSSKDLIIRIIDGNNQLDEYGFLEAENPPGETPADFNILNVTDDKNTLNVTLTNLTPGKRYFLTASSFNEFGYSQTVGPIMFIPPKQVPQSPTNIELSVNSGFSDSLLISYSAPLSDGGDEITRYRIELDPTPTFDNPIVQYESCPKSSRKTVWQVETRALQNFAIKGGSFVLQIRGKGLSQLTEEIPYDAVALLSNETGILEKLNFTTFVAYNNSATLISSTLINIEGALFVGDRVRFDKQSSKFKYYEISAVSGTFATLSEPFKGLDGIQTMSRIYGGRGDPSSSRIFCEYDEILCPTSVLAKSGSMQAKIESINFIENGILVDRDGPSKLNEFTWRITFLDNAMPGLSDFVIEPFSNSLETQDSHSTAEVVAFLIRSGETFSKCVGSTVVPRFGGLVKGLEYNARVSAMNSLGYSIPIQTIRSQAPILVPGLPTSVSLIVLSASQLRVIFASPLDNGGDAITKYKVEWSESPTFSNSRFAILDYLNSGSPFAKTIDDLSMGQLYYVRVRACNSQGYGAPQLASPNALNPHQIPEPPSNVVLGITSDELLTVRWSNPVSDGGDTVYKYRVEWDTSPTFTSINYLPHKGYVDIDAVSHSSHTIEMLSSKKVYYVRVFALNRAGMSSGGNSEPFFAQPRKQVPGKVKSLFAKSGEAPGTIDITWEFPIIPNHGIPCFGTVDNPIVCPTRYGGGIISSDGGDTIVEYEVEYNEREDFGGSDGGTRTVKGTRTTIANLHSGRPYYVRVLARNTVGSGHFRSLPFPILVT